MKMFFAYVAKKAFLTVFKENINIFVFLLKPDNHKMNS